MRKTIEMVHGKFKAVLREPKRIEKKDFTKEDLLKAKRKIDERSEEYESLGFPVWQRLGLKGVDLPYIELKSLPDCGLEHLFKDLDFEGADRKYTLMADLFYTEKICFKGSGKKRYKVKDGIDTILAVIEDDSKIEISHKGNFRISSGRFLVKSGAKLRLVDSSISGGLEISSYYFYLEDGAELEMEQGVIGTNSKVAKFVMVDGEGKFKAIVNPRVGSISSTVDVMYSAIVKGDPEVKVSGRGFTSNGKIIFRGVMDAKKGSKGSDISEKFECLFLDEKSSFEAIPSLFISENELSAEHGATAYEVPNDQIFYMMSRGLSEKESKLLIASGVFDGFDDLKSFIESHLSIGGDER